jgi:hypothetical protein
MANLQERIRDLDTYLQLDSGDPGYVAPSSLFLPLDSADFGSKPFKYPAEDFFSDIHIEKGRLTGLSSKSVSVTFDTAFSSTPVGIGNIKVYRMFEVVTGKWIAQDVQFYFGSATPVITTGFSLTIETAESLTGAILEYEFREA